MSRIVEESFDNYELDFLDESFLSDNELADCCLGDDELRTLLAPPQETWRDYLPGDNEAVITIDSAKDKQWTLAKEEITQIRSQMQTLLDVSDYEDVTMGKIVMFYLGPDSKPGRYMCNELNLSKMTYLKFMNTVFISAAYHLTSRQLFHDMSLLKAHTLMKEDKYNRVWRQMSEKRRLQRDEMSNSRREIPIWEGLETIVNEVLHAVSVTRWAGQILIALDDDKVWMNISNSNAKDLFNIKYTHHVTYTAATSANTQPIAVAIERSKDSTTDCFKRILDFLFSQNGKTNL